MIGMGAERKTTTTYQQKTLEETCSILRTKKADTNDISLTKIHLTEDVADTCLQHSTKSGYIVKSFRNYIHITEDAQTFIHLRQTNNGKFLICFHMKIDKTNSVFKHKKVEQHSLRETRTQCTGRDGGNVVLGWWRGELKKMGIEEDVNAVMKTGPQHEVNVKDKQVQDMDGVREKMMHC